MQLSRWTHADVSQQVYFHKVYSVRCTPSRYIHKGVLSQVYFHNVYLRCAPTNCINSEGLRQCLSNQVYSHMVYSLRCTESGVLPQGYLIKCTLTRCIHSSTLNQIYAIYYLMLAVCQPTYSTTRFLSGRSPIPGTCQPANSQPHV